MAGGHALDLTRVHSWSQAIAADPHHRLMQNALTVQAVDKVALRHDIVVASNPAMSNRLDNWKATHQGKSGRCWIFAGLNLIRRGAASEMGVVDFEFSQSHTMFWDKLERANFLLEAILETAHLDIDDREVAFLLDNLVNDGGQWHMFVAIVGRHGVVPKALMPETESSQNTAQMNARLRTVIRRAVGPLRAAARRPAHARAMKVETLAVIHRILTLHLGAPPTRFSWQWTDDAGGFHRDPEMSPQEFAAKYVALPLEDFVCLVHDPRSARMTGEVLTVRHLGNVVDATPVRYVNTNLDTLRDVALRTLATGEPVWFGCDCDKMVLDDLGVWDPELYDYDTVYGAAFAMTKEERVLYHDSQMTHAMVFTGADVVDGNVLRWRVENSWGAEKGRQGFYTMSARWFDEYVFEVAVRRALLPPALKDADKGEATILAPWDPMGALA